MDAILSRFIPIVHEICSISSLNERVNHNPQAFDIVVQSSHLNVLKKGENNYCIKAIRDLSVIPMVTELNEIIHTSALIVAHDPEYKEMLIAYVKEVIEEDENNPQPFFRFIDTDSYRPAGKGKEIQYMQVVPVVHLTTIHDKCGQPVTTTIEFLYEIGVVFTAHKVYLSIADLLKIVNGYIGRTNPDAWESTVALIKVLLLLRFNDRTKSSTEARAFMMADKPNLHTWSSCIKSLWH
jgi:hypothetical protein